jgi:hypothetical protein
VSEEAGFLSRWARRKQAALRGEAPAQDGPKVAEGLAPIPSPDAVLAERPPGVPLEGTASDVPAEGAQDAALVAEAAGDDACPPAPEPFDVESLPPVELLDASSDFSLFLRPGVPAALRSAALRKAWTADPLIRDYLSPLDYGWDFNTPGGLPFGFSDALGEGADKVLQLIRQAVGEPEPPPEEGAPPAEPIPEAIPLEELPPSGEVLAEAEAPPAAEKEAEPAEPPRRRHGGALPA